MKSVNLATVMLASEAARALGMSVDNVRRYGDDGVLRMVRTSAGVRLFDRGDVERLAAERAETRQS
jgi:DNA-binding transcriptional MerR regulator